MYASSGNKHFFTKSHHRQSYQNYGQSQQKLGTILENKLFKKSKISKTFINKSLSPSRIFFIEIFFRKDFTNFQQRKMTLKVQILRCLRSLLITLVSLKMK